MLRNKPRLQYSGLTIILANPSRFDKLYLLSGPAGPLMADCLRPEYNVNMCDVREMEDKTPFLEGTKCILLLGEAAMHGWCEKETYNNTLNEMRGSPLSINGIPTIASFFPQDATDYKNYEQTLNKESKEYSDEETRDDEDEGDVKRFSPTKRSNYAFWLKADMDKCKRILKNGLQYYLSSETPPTYKIYPAADEVINVLTKTKGAIIDFDMETDYEEQNILCFSFAVDDNTVYCVPVLDNDYHWAYSSLHYIMRALTVAARDNTLVAHNGAAFDFFVLGYKYHIPVMAPYDTMLALHRCFPDIEKSLGHGTSYWTWQKFHKDTDSGAYFTREHMMKKLLYCGKDVFTMRLIRKAVTKYAKTIPGLESSIECAQRSIVPYLTTTIQGLKYDPIKLAEIQKENDALMTQYMRIISLLIGEDGISRIHSSVKNAKKLVLSVGGKDYKVMKPNSNPQCCEYFHEQLGYPVLMKSTDTGKPSLGKKIMYRLALKYPDNPVIQFILLYRTLARESGTLKFMPWKDDNNKVYCENTNQIQLTGT